MELGFAHAGIEVEGDPALRNNFTGGLDATVAKGLQDTAQQVARG